LDLANIDEPNGTSLPVYLLSNFNSKGVAPPWLLAGWNLFKSHLHGELPKWKVLNHTPLSLQSGFPPHTSNTVPVSAPFGCTSPKGVLGAGSLQQVEPQI
jgi:hypothetical protein